MSTAKRVLINTGFLYGKVGITSICQILATRFVLQAMGVNDFGIYNLIASTVVMLSFLNESMTAATQRFMSFAEGEGNVTRIKSIFNTSWLIHLGLSLLVALLFLVLHPVFFGGHLQISGDRLESAKAVYYFMVASTSLTMMTVPYNAVLVAHENMLYYSIVGSVSGVLKLIISIILLNSSCDRLMLYGAMMLGVTMIEWTISRVYCHIKYSECNVSLSKYVDKSLIKEMFSFAGWQLVYSASSILSIQGMSLILNAFFGAIMNAAQGIARQVCGYLMTFSGTMMHALNPVIVKKAGSNDHQSLVHVTISGSKLSFILVVIVALPILFELPYLLNIWLTEVPDYALLFCIFEVIQQIVASFTVTLVTMISGVGDIKAFQLFSAITYILRLPLIYVAFLLGADPLYAYYIATAAVIALCVGRVYYANKKCDLPVTKYLDQVIKPCLLLCLIVVATLLPVIIFIPSSFLRFLFTCLVAIAEVCLLAYLLVFDKEEKQLVRNAVSFVKSKTHRHER